MILAVSRFRVLNGMEEEVREAFRRRPREVDGEPGFLGLEVFSDAADPALFYLVTRWTSEEAFRAWHRSPRHRRSHALIPAGLRLDPEATRLLVLDRVEPAVAADVEIAERGALEIDGAATPPEPAGDGYSATLARLNNELAALGRENARRAKELARVNRRLEAALGELENSYWHLRKLQSVLPLCMECGKVKAGRGDADWAGVADYLAQNGLLVSHGLCPVCERRMEAELDEQMRDLGGFARDGGGSD